MLFWGNPVTSGKAGIDYFISGDRMEMPCRTRALYQESSMESFSFYKKDSTSSLMYHTNNSVEDTFCRDDNLCSEDNNDNMSFDTETRKHYYRGHLRTESDAYSEQVVLLAGQGIWYARPVLPLEWKSRNYFGLPSSRSKRLKGDHQNSLEIGTSSTPSEKRPNFVVYMCAQSLFKLHPSFDFVLRDILAGNPFAIVVLIEDRRERWTNYFKQRLKHVLTKYPDPFRIHWRTAEKLASESFIFNESNKLHKQDEFFYSLESLGYLGANYSLNEVHNDTIGGNEVKSNGSKIDGLWRRVKMVARQPPGDGFMQLLNVADVHLMPFPFDGSRTSSEGFALGIPTVTLPSSQLRGRMTW